MTKAYGKGDYGKATALSAKMVRARGVCERCGVQGVPYDAAHIIRRRYSHTRTRLENMWCLCRPCHFVVDHEADEFMELVHATIGLPAFVALKERRLLKTKVDWSLELERLKALA